MDKPKKRGKTVWWDLNYEEIFKEDGDKHNINR